MSNYSVAQLPSPILVLSDEVSQCQDIQPYHNRPRIPHLELSQGAALSRLCYDPAGQNQTIRHRSFSFIHSPNYCMPFFPNHRETRLSNIA
jgi:hypothetical protein